MKEIKNSIQNFANALNKLQEGIRQAEDELERDGVLQRFEFTFELFWKTLKRILEYEGFQCQSPRTCIKQAFKSEIVVDKESFLDMLVDRNSTSHIYDEHKAKEIFERIKDTYIFDLKSALEKIKETY